MPSTLQILFWIQTSTGRQISIQRDVNTTLIFIEQKLKREQWITHFPVPVVEVHPWMPVVPVVPMIKSCGCDFGESIIELKSTSMVSWSKKILLNPRWLKECTEDGIMSFLPRSPLRPLRPLLFLLNPPTFLVPAELLALIVVRVVRMNWQNQPPCNSVPGGIGSKEHLIETLGCGTWSQSSPPTLFHFVTRSSKLPTLCCQQHQDHPLQYQVH